MQHHHEGGSGGGGGVGEGGEPPSLCGYPNPQGEAPAEVAVMSSEEHQKLGDLGIAEAASPISSRPPAPAAIGSSNFEELMRATAAEGGSTSGNRWPRQETLALLQIRSEMDVAFRDATVKGPLWEQVSRKLAELGYKRGAKKCKEKFENVHKYYKRTKEGRAGRQDGKSYKFFTQLEALHHNTSTSQVVVPRIPTTSAAAVSLLPPLPPPSQPEALLPPAFDGIGISFSSNSSSSSSSEEEDDEHDEEQDHEMETESADHNRRDRKRKRSAHVSGGAIESDERMMEFFEGLMKQVMQKQEAMQQRFLEAIEKREQDRMIREEAWKRQDMARIAREHDLMAQERALSASRDAAIIAFLEKITGQKVPLPTTTTVPVEQQQRQSESQNNQQQQQQQQRQQPPHSDQQLPQRMEIIEAGQVSNTCHEIVPAAIPKQQMQVQDITGGGSMEGMASSRWPKAEVLALIQLRSAMESRYQEAGPKGPLWEEISAGMQRMGYNRSAKRCKEKWENINKYFKKVKESNKKRPEDAKTCPYFNELDALYRKKIHGNTSGINLGGLSEQQRQQQDLGISSSLQSLQVNINVSEDKDGGKTEQMQTSGVGTYSTSTLFGGQSQADIGEPKQPEDMLKNQLRQDQQSHMMTDGNGNNNVDDGCNNSDDLDDDDDDEEVDENEEYDNHHKSEEEMKMAYRTQFQRQNVTNAAGTPPNASSFMAMQGSVISST